MLELEQDLDQAQNTGPCLQMPNIGFNGAEPVMSHNVKTAVPQILVQIRKSQPADLDRISQRSPCAVCLDVAECSWIDSRRPQTAADRFCLGIWIRCGETNSSASCTAARSLDD